VQIATPAFLTFQLRCCFFVPLLREMQLVVIGGMTQNQRRHTIPTLPSVTRPRSAVMLLLTTATRVNSRWVVTVMFCLKVSIVAMFVLYQADNCPAVR
jgi:hypothetical protein